MSTEPIFNDAPHDHPTIIGLSGYATAGKDTAAEVLTRLYGYRRIAFADKLKAFVREINPVIALVHGKDIVRADELVKGLGDTEAKTFKEYRRVLQVAGTTVREFFGINTWVNAALGDVEAGDYVVVTDVRFPNEAQAIKDMGGIVLRVQRPGVGPANQHVSEIGLDNWPFDGFILNDGTPVDLEGEVQRVLGDLG